jgi:hypothetical protein
VVNRFFVLEIGSRTQYKFAWSEPFYRKPEEYRTSDDCPTCPHCGGAIGMRSWLPPHRVAIKQPRKIGDFLDGPFSFVVSERFKLLYEKSTLTGIKEFHPLEVVQMAARKKEYTKPSLFGVDVVHSRARINYDLSVTKWWKLPQSDYCRKCGPGGGGKGGTAERFEGLHFEHGTWQGEDFFYPINLSGIVVVSESGAAFVKEHSFTNVSLSPAEGYCHDMFEGDFSPILA